MPKIKRYPNRKLYDTEAKQYITLDGIAEMIRQGREIQVIDYTTGEDLTAITLTQIIYEEEKKQSGFLPRSVLAGLIQAGGDRLNALQRNLLSSIGFLHQVDEEIKRRMVVLINEGNLDERQAQRLTDQLLSVRTHTSPEEEQAIEIEVERLLAERQIPTREDFEQIFRSLDALTDKLDAITAESSSPDLDRND